MTLTKDKIKKALKQALVLQGKIDTDSELLLDIDYRKIYDIDDLDIVEITMSLEHSLGLKLNDEYLQGTRKLSHILNYVYRIELINKRKNNEKTNR